jgi:hypothetical protein
MKKVDPNTFRVLNMLNTKYFIFPGSDENSTVPIENPYAYGNAWFVDSVEYVNNANEEIDALNTVHPARIAIVDVRFKNELKGVTGIRKDTVATIRLNDYQPNRLVYETSSATDGIVVFSEIYYPGWEATIDGVPVNIARSDYILRAMHVPAGKHTVEMWFKPKSIKITDTIAYGGLGILVAGVLALLVKYGKKVHKTIG